MSSNFSLGNWRLWFLGFLSITSFVMIYPNQTASMAVENFKSSSYLRIIQEKFNIIPEDQYRVALVMPCSFIEAVTSLPIALNSIMECKQAMSLVFILAQLILHTMKPYSCLA